MSVKIEKGKNGFHLKVNGVFIRQEIDFSVRSILPGVNGSVPYGATEWISVEAIRKFWEKYRVLSIHASEYKTNVSNWGQLIPVRKPF